MTDTTEVYDRRPRPAPRGGGDNRRPSSDVFLVAAGALISVIVVIVVVLALLSDDDTSVDTTDTSATVTTTETTADESTTTETTASTTTESTVASSETSTTVDSTTSSPATTSSTTQTTSSTVVDPDTYLSAVWPWQESTVRYTDPVGAAHGFAVDFIGFVDPVVGEFQQGDSRSGEVEVQPTTDGPITVVFVRQLGPDDDWWILGAATANVTIEEPSTLSTIASPQTLTGAALAFEGHVDVVLRADGVAQPLVETFVTGGGDVVRPFEGTLEWTDPEPTAGALVLTTSGGEDGRIQEAAVRRVLFNDT